MSLQWYEWHTATERLQGRLFALTKGRPYRFQFDLNFPTGYTDLNNHVVGVNPLAFNDVFVNQGLVGEDRDEANFLITRAITGHEAMHAVYTDPADFDKTLHDEDLKNIMNILEDARIEHIGAEESHVQKTLFRLLNATAHKMTPPFEDPDLNDPYSALQLLLTWKQGFAIPDTLTEDARKKWIKLRNMAEEALYAPTSADVLRISKKVQDFLGLHRKKQDQQQPNPLRDALDELLRRLSGQMKGQAEQKPQQNPLEDPQKQDNGQGQNGDQAQNQQSGGGQDQQQSQGDQDNSQDDPQQNKAQARNGNGQEKKDDQDSGDRQQDANFDLKDVVKTTSKQVQDGVKEATPQGVTQQMLRAAGIGQYQPDVIGRAYNHIYQDALPIAQVLIKELKAEAPKAVKAPSRYPGKIRARYLIRDGSKPFAQEKLVGIKTPKMAMTLILDRSGSMSSMMYNLQVMTTAIYLACEKLRIPLAIWALEGQVHLKKHDEWGPHVLAKIAGLEAVTGTQMMPTIKDATAELKKRPEEMKQVVVIHDGSPCDGSEVISWRNSLRPISHYCMYICKAPNSKAARGKLERRSPSLEALFGAQNYCVAYIDEVAKYWCSYLKCKRGGMGLRAA